MFDKLAIIVAAILVLLLLFIGFNNSAYLTNWKGVLLYIGAPCVVLAIIGCSFLLSYHHRKLLYISGLSVAASAYMFEGLLWYKSFAPFLPSGADKRSQLEVVQQYRMSGVPAFPAISPIAIASQATFKVLKTDHGDLLPLGGISNVRTVHCNESGQWRIFLSDELGFPNPSGLWSLPEIEVIAIGDSFTQGACVPEDQDFVSVIRRRFPSTINLGAGGNGPLSELASIEEYALIKRPKYIVWFYYQNDLQQDLQREKKHPLLKKYLHKGFRQNLMYRQPEIDKGVKEFIESLPVGSESNPNISKNQNFELSQIFGFADGVNPLARVPGLTLSLTRRALGLSFGGGEWPSPDQNTFKTIMSIAQNKVASWGGKLLFVILPSWDSIILGDRRKDNYSKAARSVAQDLGIVTLDLTELFKRQPNPNSLWPHGRPGHYSEAGHNLVGRAVTSKLLHFTE